MLTDVVNDLRFKRLYRDMHFEWVQYIRNEKRFGEIKYGQIYTLLHFGKLDNNTIIAAGIKYRSPMIHDNRTYPDAVVQYFPIIGEIAEESGVSPTVVASLLIAFATTQINDIYEIMTPPEASNQWGLSKDTVRAALTRGKFDKQIEKGLVRKSGNQWLIHRDAMLEVYGEPKEKLV